MLFFIIAQPYLREPSASSMQLWYVMLETTATLLSVSVR